MCSLAKWSQTGFKDNRKFIFLEQVDVCVSGNRYSFWNSWNRLLNLTICTFPKPLYQSSLKTTVILLFFPLFRKGTPIPMPDLHRSTFMQRLPLATARLRGIRHRRPHGHFVIIFKFLFFRTGFRETLLLQDHYSMSNGFDPLTPLFPEEMKSS